MTLALAPLARKFAGYFVTGGLAAVVDVGVFAALHAAGLATLPAAAASFLVAAVANYQLSARFVFGSTTHLRGQALFLAVACLGLAVNVSGTLAAEAWLGLDPVLAKVAGIAVAFTVNFVLNLTIVFRR